MRSYGVRFLMGVVAFVILLVAGCGSGGDAAGGDGGDVHAWDEVPQLSPVSLAPDEKLRVVATTSIVADVVGNVGGERIELSQLMPLGTDPHAFEPTPRDVVTVSDAHVVFISGAGLETFIEDLWENAGRDLQIVPVSSGIDLLAYEGASAEDADHDDHDHTGDPHTWFDPHNVSVWVDTIRDALIALDPANAAAYEAQAASYQADLDALNGWIREQIQEVPEERRKLVTDHASLTYFAVAYGFEEIGVIVPGYSTLAEPSAQQVVALQDVIAEHGVTAVFVSTTVNPRMAEQIARDTGVRLVFLYTGSLSEAGGPADTYLRFMRYNVSQITEALR